MFAKIIEFIPIIKKRNIQSRCPNLANHPNLPYDSSMMTFYDFLSGATLLTNAPFSRGSFAKMGPFPSI